MDSIRLKVIECDTLFANVRYFARVPNSQFMVDQHEKFKVWYRNIGAHLKTRRSLDQQLRDASFIRHAIVELLDGLKEILEKASIPTGEEDLPIAERDSSNVIKEQREELCQTILGSLLRLSASIRDPAPYDRYAQSKKIDVSFYTAYDRNSIEEMFPKADSFLKERMLDATLQRRRFLKYSIAHHAKLAQPLKNDDGSDWDMDTEYNYTGSRASKLPPALDLVMDGVPVSFGPGGYPASEASSVTSYTSSSDSGRKHRVPQPPANAVLGGDPFECPYCFLLVSCATTQDWRKHVYHDIQPYFCTFRDCDKGNELFPSHHKWFQHERQVHRKTWICPGYCAASVDTKVGLETHILKHQPELKENNSLLSALVSGCERQMSPADSAVCPFCRETILTLKSIRKHIGRHLRDLSLRALPLSLFEEDSGSDLESANPLESDSDDAENEQEVMPKSEIKDKYDDKVEPEKEVDSSHRDSKDGGLFEDFAPSAFTSRSNEKPESDPPRPSSSRTRLELLGFTTPKWPNPEASIGVYVGMYRGKTIWEAVGPARDVFQDPDFTHHLQSILENTLRNSAHKMRHPVLGFRGCMVGKTRETAEPALMLTSDNSRLGKECVKAVKNSELLLKYPGVKIVWHFNERL